MDNILDPKEWMKRAKGNLKLGRKDSYKDLEDITIEDLCFNLQQSAEKSIKSLLLLHNISFPKSHDIADLLKILRKNTTIEIPEDINNASELTPYAVLTRYPHWNKISDDDYNDALEISEKVYFWVKEQMDSSLNR